MKLCRLCTLESKEYEHILDFPFKLYESNKIKPCLKPSPKAKAEDAITTLSTDFRTFGNDPITNERVSYGLYCHGGRDQRRQVPDPRVRRR